MSRDLTRLLQLAVNLIQTHLQCKLTVTGNSLVSPPIVLTLFIASDTYC